MKSINKGEFCFVYKYELMCALSNLYYVSRRMRKPLGDMKIAPFPC